MTITQDAVSYPDLPKLSLAANSAPFAFTLAGNAVCGLTINFTVTVNYAGGQVVTTGADLSPLTFNFKVQTGRPGNNPQTISYSGTPVAIPDFNSSAGNPGVAVIPINVGSITDRLSKLRFRIDGSSCSATPNSTAVGLDHTYVGDLAAFLVSPEGTIVTLFNQTGGGGINFCNTLLDEDASKSIQSVVAGEAPFTGTYAPAGSLSDFIGEDPNGMWQLYVFDLGAGDTGHVRAFSLEITSFACAGGGGGVTSGAALKSRSPNSARKSLIRQKAVNNRPLPHLSSPLPTGSGNGKSRFEDVKPD